MKLKTQFSFLYIARKTKTQSFHFTGKRTDKKRLTVY